MAAYAALSSLSKTIDLFGGIILQGAEGVHRTSPSKQLLQQLKKAVGSLLGNTDFLRSFLQRTPQETADPFLAQIKEAADEAEGIIGRFVSEQLRSKLAADDDDEEIFRSLCHQLQRVSEDLIKIIRYIDETDSDEESLEVYPSRYIPLPRDNVLIGVEGVFEELERLVVKRSSTQLQVVSIVGMGGIGKTSVARSFYDHTFTLELFDIHGWVTVSKDFTARDILLRLSASIQPYVRHPKLRNESIENHVHKNLKNRRFLIALDDVWSQEALRFLMRTFPDDSNGSQIMLTTRLKEAADQANLKQSMHTVTMRLLDPIGSYRLLWHKVFPQDYCPPQLKHFFERIAHACGGLPLAIVLVGGILYAIGTSFSKWENLARELIRGSKSGYELVDLILSLSYRQLPHHLRPCLLYMGAFPEDHDINVSMLTKQLFAQDFMKKATSLLSIYDEVDDQFLQELVKRNLVSVLKWKSDDGIKSINLHDLVRDFCLKKAQEEEFLHCITDNDCDQELAGKKIKVTFNLDGLKRICNSDAADDTHTIMCFGHGRSKLVSIGRFRLLKSLDLVNVEIKSFPMEVFDQLLLLRLLALSYVPELPPSISNLQYLETLIINPRDRSISLPYILCVPDEIWTMAQLRHIISFCCGPFPNPGNENLPPLLNLETLSAVMNLECSKELMKMIPNIKKLGIFYFGVEGATHSIRNIECLHRLEKLKVWVLEPFSFRQSLDLGFPASLRKLTLRGIRLSHRDMTIVGHLSWLEVLKLRESSFESDEWRVTGYGFSAVKYLLLEKSNLKHWVCDDFRSFSALESLVIHACNDLSEIPISIGKKLRLQLIEVVGGNKSLGKSARSLKEKQRALEFNHTTFHIKNKG